MNLLHGNPVVKQCDLILDSAGNHMERLLHIAKELPLFLLWNPVCGDAANGNAAGIGEIKAQQQLEDSALSCAGPSGQGDLLTGLHLKAQVAEYRVTVIAEGSIPKLHKGSLRLPELLDRDAGLIRKLRLSQKIVDAPHTCNGGLNGLNFHAQALYGGENLGNVIHDRYSRTGRHAKQC